MPTVPQPAILSPVHFDYRHFIEICSYQTRNWAAPVNVGWEDENCQQKKKMKGWQQDKAEDECTDSGCGSPESVMYFPAS